MDVTTARRAAVARVQAREMPVQWKVVGKNPDGSDVKMQTGGGPGTFERPQDAGQWFDDRVVFGGLLDGDPAYELLADIAAAAWDGEKAVRAAVAGGRKLGEWPQWIVYSTLGNWRGRDTHPQAQQLIGAAIAEWRRLGLVTQQPEAQEAGRVVTANQPDLDAADKRRRVSRGW